MGLNDLPALPALPPVVAFGRYRLDSVRLELTHQGRPLALRPKVYALLTYLVAHPGRALGKQELMAFLWPNVVVAEDSLVQCVAELRAALGPEGAQLVTTVPRHGYRFDGVLEPKPQAAATPRAAIVARRSYRPAALGAAGLAALVLTLAALWPRSAIDADRAFRRERSLAVLPLVPRGSRSTQDFAEAMTDELIGDIARLPGTTVIARASAATAAARQQDLRRC